MSPPEIIDKVWHLHLLDTVNYWHDTDWCSDSCHDDGPRIIHNPDSSFDSKSIRWARARNTVLAYRIRFGPKPEDLATWRFPAFDDVWDTTPHLDDDPLDHLDADIAHHLSDASKVNKNSHDIQRLIHNAVQLDNDRSLASYNIKGGDNIHLVLRLSGC